MIVVVCLNPALDVTHHVDAVDWGGVNRSRAVRARPGGKGLNVARTLHALGVDVLALGLAGGLTGAGMEAALRELSVPAAFTPDGLLAATGDGCWRARPPAAVAGNATGAGDAVAAALAHGLVLGRPWDERLRHAAALGAATAAAPVAGEFRRQDYLGALSAVTVEEVR